MKRRAPKTPCPLCTRRDQHTHEKPGLTIRYGSKPEESGMRERILLAVRGQEIAWFRAHPTERVYFRRAVPGEFPADVTAEWVRVIKVDDEADQRVREPCVKRDGAFVPWTPGGAHG